MWLAESNPVSVTEFAVAGFDWLPGGNSRDLLADGMNCYFSLRRSDTPAYKSNAPMECSQNRIPVPLHLQTMVGSGLFRSEAIVPRYET